MAKFLHSQRSRFIRQMVLVSIAAGMLMASHGCSQTTDTDPAAKPVPTSREAK
ncbi:MAG: hypothetical protein H7145_01435 [Akkermansiaceae bacterium]|nr:hypothetical protein [Armatimonadota bacterium]